MDNSLPQVTQGLAPTGTGSFAPMLLDGLQASPPEAVKPTSTDAAMPLVSLVPSATLSPDTLAALKNKTIVHDVLGRAVGPSSAVQIDLGGGSVLYFDESNLYARTIPYMEPTVKGGNKLYDDCGTSMFTASDCRIMIEIPQTPVFNGSTVNTRIAKQLLESTTLSVSIHRSKSPVRAFGYANPKGFARGSRTIAGTLVVSKMTAEVLYRFLQAELMADLTRDTIYTKLDQIPPIDFTLLFSNEVGYVSTQRLLGVEFVTDGSVISVQDALMEQQISWMAMDFTPLVPLNFDTFFGISTKEPNATRKQKTPADLIVQRDDLGYIPLQSEKTLNMPGTRIKSRKGSGVQSPGFTGYGGGQFGGGGAGSSGKDW